MRRLLATSLALLLALASARPATAHLHTATAHRPVVHSHAPVEPPQVEASRKGAFRAGPHAEGYAQHGAGSTLFFKLTPTAPKPSFKVLGLVAEAHVIRVDMPFVRTVFLADPLEPVPPRAAPLPGRAPPSQAPP